MREGVATRPDLARPPRTDGRKDRLAAPDHADSAATANSQTAVPTDAHAAALFE